MLSKLITPPAAARPSSVARLATVAILGLATGLSVGIPSAFASTDDAAAAAAPLPPPPEAAPIVTPTYTVGAGDSIKLRVYEEDRLNGTYIVSPDGRVDLPWVGKVSVTGLAPEQIADLVESRYADGYLVSPQVVVEVEAYGSKPVQLLGNIKNPGTYFLEGPTDLVGLLARAGGLAKDDQLSTYEVQIKRARTEAVAPVSLSLDRLMHLGEGNVKVESGDVIHITRGRIVYVSGQVVRPGAVAYKEGLTLTQVLAAAGGPARTANLRKVLLIRGEQRLKVSIQDIQRGRANDIKIQPDDQVIIEESAF
jgi:protein involved in polysaccharide export with SLBB domain